MPTNNVVLETRNSCNNVHLTITNFTTQNFEKTLIILWNLLNYCEQNYLDPEWDQIQQYTVNKKYLDPEWHPKQQFTVSRTIWIQNEIKYNNLLWAELSWSRMRPKTTKYCEQKYLDPEWEPRPQFTVSRTILIQNKIQDNNFLWTELFGSRMRSKIALYCE